MNGHIYIAYLREFIRNGEDIYKIGKTGTVATRPTGYPKGTIFLFTSYVGDIKLAEHKIIETLNIKTTRRLDYGKEYFEGNYKFIRDIVINIIDEINLNSRVRFINSKIKLDDLKLAKKKDVYKEFVSEFLTYNENDKERLKQSEINLKCVSWLAQHNIYRNIHYCSMELKVSVEKVFGAMIKSLQFKDKKISRGWKHIGFSK